MAIIGYWDSLAEAQKLVQHELLLAGVVEEIYKEGDLMPKLPVFQINSKEIAYYREDTLPSGDFYDIGEELPWVANVKYSSKVTVELKRVADQRPLDKFMMQTYRTPNDYRAQVLREITKGLTQWLEGKLVYGNSTDHTKEFDGMAALVDSDMDINMGAALSVAKLRELVDSVRPRPNLLMCNREYGQMLDAMLQEKGFTTWANFTFTANDLGQRVMRFDGIPILRSDYITEDEDADALETGNGGAKTSIYAIRFGQIMEGGLCLAMGGEGGELGKVMRIERFEKLEDFDAEGIRVVGYVAMALGSTKALGRIRNITPGGAVTAT